MTNYFIQEDKLFHRTKNTSFSIMGSSVVSKVSKEGMTSAVRVPPLLHFITHSSSHRTQEPGKEEQANNIAAASHIAYHIPRPVLPLSRRFAANERQFHAIFASILLLKGSNVANNNNNTNNNVARRGKRDNEADKRTKHKHKRTEQT